MKHIIVFQNVFKVILMANSKTCPLDCSNNAAYIDYFAEECLLDKFLDIFVF